MEVERIRRDNRAFDQIRPVSVKLGVLENADGSADFSQGHTRVIASVHGPVAAKSRYEQIDRATIKVTVESYNSAPSLKDVAMAQRLERIIEAVVFDILNPRSLICITIQPVLLDGSYFSVAINAAIAALLDSGVPMKNMVFSASCICDSAGNLLIDSEASEESADNRSEHVLVYDPRDFSTAIAMHHFGKFNLDLIPQVSKLITENAILPIKEVVTAAIKEKIEKTIK